MKDSSQLLLNPSERQFRVLNQAFQYFNQHLFKGILPDCILSISRRTGIRGFLAPKRWRENADGNYTTHEIALTMECLSYPPDKLYSTLVHEQVHLWQFEFGKVSPWGYHNMQWAKKMIEVGLMPTDTGKEGGKITGQKVTHYIIDGSAYDLAFRAMPKDYILPFKSWESAVHLAQRAGDEMNIQSDSRLKRMKEKIKYSCKYCQINVWGKPDLKLICGNCHQAFLAVYPDI